MSALFNHIENVTGIAKNNQSQENMINSHNVTEWITKNFINITLAQNLLLLKSLFFMILK